MLTALYRPDGDLILVRTETILATDDAVEHDVMAWTLGAVSGAAQRETESVSFRVDWPEDAEYNCVWRSLYQRKVAWLDRHYSPGKRRAFVERWLKSTAWRPAAPILTWAAVQQYALGWHGRAAFEATPRWVREEYAEATRPQIDSVRFLTRIRVVEATDANDAEWSDWIHSRIEHGIHKLGHYPNAPSDWLEVTAWAFQRNLHTERFTAMDLAIIRLAYLERYNGVTYLGRMDQVVDAYQQWQRMAPYLSRANDWIDSWLPASVAAPRPVVGLHIYVGTKGKSRYRATIKRVLERRNLGTDPKRGGRIEIQWEEDVYSNDVDWADRKLVGTAGSVQVLEMPVVPSRVRPQTAKPWTVDIWRDPRFLATEYFPEVAPKEHPGYRNPRFEDPSGSISWDVAEYIANQRRQTEYVSAMTIKDLADIVAAFDLNDTAGPHRRR